MRCFGQGPLEKLWRLVTWGRSSERRHQRRGHSRHQRHDQRLDRLGAVTSSRE
ncbi:MAG: hypothetical protein ACTIIH_16085 [Brevibacterium sp.]|uniref:hypothetical protein n=1 Tax=Brevibacterium sp. TaxID=1701 RepID=UPI003F93ED7D